MVSRVISFLALVVVLVSAAAILAIASTFANKNNCATLAGLSGVYVVIENIDMEARLDGLDKNKLRRAAEAVLTQAGVPILSETQMLKSPGSPFLYFVINTFKNDNVMIYAFHVRAELRQTVRLDRNPSITSTAPTWQSTEPTGLIGEDRLKLLSAAIEKCATEFVVEYLKANQR